MSENPFRELIIEACKQHYVDPKPLGSTLILSEATIERFAQLVAEHCAKTAESVPDRSGVNEDGGTWLMRATKHDAGNAIRQKFGLTPPQAAIRGPR